MCDEKLPPDEELTKIIVGKLLAEGLIPERRSDAITNSILAGTASATCALDAFSVTKSDLPDTVGK